MINKQIHSYRVGEIVVSERDGQVDRLAASDEDDKKNKRSETLKCMSRISKKESG